MGERLLHPDSMTLTLTTTREELLSRLGEAAELEHNLMCVYLYAAFSLKTGPEAGNLSPAEAEAVGRWNHEILAVAREEMVHLLLVSNLLVALGGAAHFGRMNFPIPPGSLPADMQVRLAPFDRETVQHLVWLERPDGADEAIGAGFEPTQLYERGGLAQPRLMPHAIDYPTVGAFYGRIEEDLRQLAGALGEDRLFIGDPAGQVGPELVALPGVKRVQCLASALSAIDGIVAQGEGGKGGDPNSHYARFCAIRQDYDQLLSRNPAFVPARAAAQNPVMRRPPTPEGKVWIEAPDAAAVVDLANAIYAHMLRLLIQAFGRPGDPQGQNALIDASIGLMFALSPVARAATQLPARAGDPGAMAGMSFATMRSIAVLPRGPAEWRMLTERMDELAARARVLRDSCGHPELSAAAQVLDEVAGGFAGKAALLSACPTGAAPAPAVAAPLAAAPVSTTADGVERADGAKLTILFEARRCIHARFCVTGLPDVFKANVEGPWINPDAAGTEALVGVAHACPSGAIRYLRHDGGDEEAAPVVNLLRIRENGPYAIHAAVDLAGHGALFRATLCRCGKSRNKPFCDNSHIDAGFEATGEPASRESEPLPVRGGTVDVAPQRNGPLVVRGPIEILAGTGRTVDRGTGARLCRCGGSRTKPFCDNSHLTNGFSSD
jgi:CDGSH-type Zn-finger protein/uncharacterized Fe-S cluster protein YjdI